MKHLLKTLSTLTAICFTMAGSQAQVTVIPKWFDADDAIRIEYNSQLGNGALNGQSTIYGHFGLITDASTDNTDWKHVVGTWGQADNQVLMTREGGNLFSKEYTIDSFHNLPANEQLQALTMVFRNESGTVVGKQANDEDFLISGSDGSFQSEFTSHAANSLDVAVNTRLELRGESSYNSNIRIQLDGQTLASANNAKVVEYTLRGADHSRGSYTLTLDVDTGAGYFTTDQINIERLSGVVAQDAPAGMEDGITVIGSNKVHLQLRAPNKPWAFVLGDFNNWQLDSAYLMTPTPDGQTFWIQIDNLSPQTRYRFQYYVGPNGVKIADPYSELILDPWNDQFIDQQTFPNRPFYPAGQSGFVSVFQTDEPEYNWDNSISYQRPDNRDLVIYELLVREFDERHTFQSVIDRLDYLEELNINALQLMPVMEFEGNDSWGYNPSYMLATDKYYGPKNDLKRLIEECHRRGIAVILDITLNHQFVQSPLCQLYWDDVNNQPAADNPWFNTIARHPYNVGYDMNHDSPHTQYFSKRVFKYWLEEFRVDGFRVDMSKGFTQNNTLGNVAGWNAYDQARIDRLNDYGNYCWGITPGAYMILEHFADNSEETVLSNNGFMLWGDMNYSYNQAVIGFGGDLSGTLASNRGWWGKNLIAYMESHDEERIGYEAKEYGNTYNGNHNVRDLAVYADRNAMGAVLLLSTPGPKMLWQFGELAYDYSIDFCIGDSTISGGCHIGRKPVRWDYYEDPDRKAAFNTWANMIHLRTTQAAFRNDPLDYFMGGTVKTIRLQDGNRHFVVVANTDVVSQAHTTYFPITGRWYSLLDSDSIQVANNLHNWTLGPGEYRVFCNDNIPLPNAPFAPDLLPDYVGLCDLNGDVLTAAPGFGPYTWSDGSTGSSLSVTQDGWYTVSITNAFGDVHTDSTWVNIDCSTPAIGTYAPNLITANSAAFSGELVSNGSAAPTAVGFVFGTSPNPTLADSVISLSPSSTFSGNAANLIPGITHYVRAFATNANGTAYGNQRSFTTASGNYDLTFRVDMRNETISPNGVFVAGDFQQLAGFTNNWDPTACPMLDADGDTIYEYTVNLPSGDYEFKFINGNDWSFGESIPAACAVNENRGVTLTTDFAITAPCFNSCGRCDTTSSGTFDLTFQVDMNEETVSPLGVHVAGDFQLDAGYAANWDPSLTELTDPDGDGVYELTVTLPAGTYQYKFVNGNAWGSDESVPSACNVMNNRSIDVIGDMSTPLVCFESCSPCNAAPLPDVDLTFRVDMSNTIVSANGVHVAGDFQAAAGFAADWDPALTALSDPDGDSIYTLTVTVPAGTYEYKFINGNAWGSDESVPAACGVGFNRQMTLTGNTTLPVVCFASCGPCTNLPPQTLYGLTFRVDMSQQDSIHPMGVFVAGDFQSEAGFGGDWNPAGSPMSDVDGDSIYELTVQVPAGIYEYKFLNGNTWPDEESVPSYCSFNGNRSLSLSGDTALPEVCFSACEPCSSLPPSSFSLTFSVDMRNEVISPNGVHVSGNFMIAAGIDTVNWRPDTLQMTDLDGDTVYEITVNVPAGVYEYKFINGNSWADEEVISGGCLSGTNRVILVNSNQVLSTVCFGSCSACQAPPPPPSNVNVTFRVDMNNQTVSPDGVHIAGNFQVAAGFPTDWAPNTTALTDVDGDSIYTVSVQIPAGTYEYKFINGNAWGSDESLIGLSCEVNGNRAVTVSSDTTLEEVCYGSCSPCGGVTTYDLTFRVDMREENISPLGVHVAGDFQFAAGYASNWDPSLTELTDPDADSIYTLTVSVPAGTYSYKFINGNAWGDDESVPLACSTNNNRTISLTGDATTPLVCYESCSPCVTGPIPDINITFRVDMNNETVSTDGVHVAGNFQAAAGFAADWDPSGSPMSDGDNDGIYTLTVTVPAGTYQYKFVNGNAWGSDESVPGACAVGFNRELTTSADTTLDAICFSSCSPCQVIPIVPSLTTSMAMNIGTNSAVVGGDVSQDGGAAVTETGVIYSIMPAPYTAADTLVIGSGTGSFSTTLSGLDASTTYYYQAYATNSAGTAYGSEMSFTTQTIITGPTVNTDAAQQVDSLSAIVGGTVLDDGGAPVTARGVVYSTTASPDTSDMTTLNGTGTGAFSSPISGLQPSTIYFYRAYAINSAGIAYGSELSFTTTASPTPPPSGCTDYGAVANTPGNYTVQLSWNAIGTPPYSVNFREVGDTTWARIVSQNNAVVIRNRQPADYEFYISLAGDSMPSCVGTFTTVCDDYNYSVNVFQIVDATGGKANVFGIDGGRRRWDIALIDGTDTTWALNRWSRFFTNLQPGDYSVIVRDAYGCYSSQVDSFSIDAIDSNTIPQLLNIERPQGASAGVLRPVWTIADTSNIDRYQVRVKDMTSGGLGTLYGAYIAVGSGTTQYDVSGLPPARYRIDVRGRVNGSFANGVYSNFRERIVTSASKDAAGDAGEGDESQIMQAYPNPTTAQLFVKAPLNSLIQLSDLQGRVLEERKADEAEEAFSLAHLANGVYLVRITTQDRVYTEQIVKD